MLGVGAVGKFVAVAPEGRWFTRSCYVSRDAAVVTPCSWSVEAVTEASSTAVTAAGREPE
jgi:hypothetical protein